MQLLRASIKWLYAFLGWASFLICGGLLLTACTPPPITTSPVPLPQFTRPPSPIRTPTITPSTPTPHPPPTASPTMFPTYTPRPTSTPEPTPDTPFKRVEDGPGREEIQQLWIAPDGDLWVVAEGDIFAHDAGEWHQINAGFVERVLGADPLDRVWVLLKDSTEVAVYEDAQWRTYGEEEGWKTDLTRGYNRGDEIVIDRRGDLWMIDAMGDLRRLDAQTDTWEHFTPGELGFTTSEDDQSGDVALTPRDITIDANGNVWIVAGCNIYSIQDHVVGQSVRWYDGETWHSSEETAGECVADVEVDANGHVWIAGHRNLIEYDPQAQSWSQTDLNSFPEIDDVLDADLTDLTLHEGRLWLQIRGGMMATTSNFYYLQDGEWVHLDLKPSLLIFGPDGTLWALSGQEQAIYKVIGNPPSTGESFASPHYHPKILVDGDGRVWFTTYNELWYLEP